MSPADQGRFTVGVFQDAVWARRGIEALVRDGFVPESITILALESPATIELVESLLGAPPDRIELKALGAVVVKGPLLAALQGDDAGQDSSRTTGIFSRPSQGAAGFWWAFAASPGPPMCWPSCTRTAAATRRSGPGRGGFNPGLRAGDVSVGVQI